MEEKNSIEILNNLKRGMFCVIEFPLTDKLSCPVPTIYLGKSDEEHYNFFDGSSGKGIMTVDCQPFFRQFL